MSITVVIVDDQAMVRAGFAALLDAQADIQVVGDAADGEQAIAIVRRAQPDVVLMDVRMPIMDGLEAARRLIEQFARQRPATPGKSLRLTDLTARESEVLGLVAAGLSNAEVARSLVVAEQTVKTHVGRIFTKLNLRDRAQAVVFAYESGLIRPGSGTELPHR